MENIFLSYIKIVSVFCGDYVFRILGDFAIIPGTDSEFQRRIVYNDTQISTRECVSFNVSYTIPNCYAFQTAIRKRKILNSSDAVGKANVVQSFVLVEWTAGDSCNAVRYHSIHTPTN